MSSQTATDAAIAAINNSVSVIQELANRTANIVYDSTNNKTKIYGHTNFEELNVLGSPVALQSQLPDMTTKANVVHEHKTDDITRDITTTIVNEEEEEEEVTETVSLNDILDGKCETVHTHSSADIANWATATENFARLNANNTFSGNQTVNGSLSVSTNKQLYVGVGSSPISQSILCKYEGNLGNGKYIRIGCGDNKRTAIMAFGVESGTRYLYFKLQNKSAEIDVYDSTVRIKGNTTLTGTLTATGDITAPNITTITNTLAGKANASHSHKTSEITRDITETVINENEEEEEVVVATIGLNTILDDKADVGHTHTISEITNLQTTLDGKASTSHTHDYSSTYAGINHNHDSSYAGINHNHDSTYAAISHTHAISDVTNLQTTLDGKASSSHNHDSTYAAINHNHDSTYAPLSHTHTSSQITDLEALKIAIFDMIYPIGSIYITMEMLEVVAGFEIDPETGIEYSAADERIGIWIGNSRWRLLNEGAFLMNVSVTQANPYMWLLGDSGETGGAATHTHTTADHTLTIQEMPSHNHGVANNIVWEYNGRGVQEAPSLPYTPITSYTTTTGGLNGVTQPHNHGNTGSASSLPPYITCYMYKRIA